MVGTSETYPYREHKVVGMLAAFDGLTYREVPYGSTSRKARSKCLTCASCGYREHMTTNDPATDQLPALATAEEAPSDGTTLTAILASYEQAGFDAQLASTEDGRVRCYSCGSCVVAASVIVHSLRRLEGASDPADTLAVAAVTCPVCQANGMLVLNYGPAATAGDAGVLLGLQDNRADDVLPGSQDPSEAERGEA